MLRRFVGHLSFHTINLHGMLSEFLEKTFCFSYSIHRQMCSCREPDVSLLEEFGWNHIGSYGWSSSWLRLCASSILLISWSWCRRRYWLRSRCGIWIWSCGSFLRNMLLCKKVVISYLFENLSNYRWFTQKSWNIITNHFNCFEICICSDWFRHRFEEHLQIGCHPKFETWLITKWMVRIFFVQKIFE